MAKFFIDRPIFAWVIAIIISIAGALSVLRLPISQYPAVAPPAISITASYPGASARTLEETVTQVIEQRMTGLDGLRYLSSSSDATGGANVELVFEPGTNPDIAQVQVQNKLQLAMPQLPQEVQRQGVRVAKSNRNFLLIAAFVSKDGSMTRNDIADYVFSTLQDPISRIPGVGDVQVFGAQYAMRIWLDPEKLAALKLTPLDVQAAVFAQNAQVSVGEFGGAPAVKGQMLNATITAQSRLQTPTEFEQILLRVNPDGSHVRLEDVARVELTGENFNVESFYNGRPCSGLGIRLAAGANALATADAVKERFAELAPTFPPGLETAYPVDTTPFVRISIEEVVKTLLEAIGLVFLVMLLFLQNVRATLIPTLAVPVVLLGTFGVISAFGYSINVLTLFGMVLAIGLLVDDAIVVVENVERVMHDEGLSPKEATRKSMKQITGALVGIALVLAAVFVPMAFFGGSVGVIYKQFSITLVSAMALSVIVALTFTPALCASILKPMKHGKRRGLYGLFNRGYDATNRGYAHAVGRLVKRRWYSMAVFLAIAGSLGLLFPQMKKSFLPEEDQGLLNAQVLLPPGATQEQTIAVMDRITKHFLETEKEAVEDVMSITGFGFGGRGQNVGLAFVKLRHWDDRGDPKLSAKAVAARSMGVFSRIKEAAAFTFAPPAIPELGTVGGFSFQLQDRAGLGRDALLAARDQLLGLAAKHPKLARVRQGGLEDRPEYKLEVDREKAAALGLSLLEINQTLSMTWGGAYVNDFIDDGRTKRVYMQADAKFRMQPSDLDRWYVRNRAGEMVPFSAFAKGKWGYGSPKLDRFNGFPTIAINGEASPGHSSGEAMAAMEEIASQMPPGIGYQWSGISWEERASGANALALYALSLLVVFLCLAALYESWTIPISVLLVVPLGVVGAVGATLLFGLANDVYFQVGLLATMGLAAKNAILIVEFAKSLVEQGKAPGEAAIEAARMRLRPIIMTSLAFVLGVLPLAIASGAGAGAQNAIGIAVIGGVVAATILGVLFVPVFFTVISRKKKQVVAATVLALFAGCSLAPTYERPASPVANQWEAAAGARSAAELGWRDVFGDPAMQSVIETALANNRDLRIAALNVELVRAQYRIERASLFPTLAGVAGVDARGTKDDAVVTYTIGGSLSYELDLFGRLKSQRTAALEEYLASAEAQRAARMVLVSEVATQFLILRAFDEQLALANQTLGLVHESSEVTRRLLEQGQRSELDLRTAEAQIAGARAEVARVKRLRAQAENALVLLAGVPKLPSAVSTPLETMPIVADLAAGIPSETLLRRPDILAAEHALKAANANIGAARAAFFPSISLTGFAGLASTALSSLFTAGAFAWTAGGQLTAPLFTGGRNRATLDVAHVRKRIEIARYEGAIQNAFREVADGLSARAAIEEQLAAQTARVDAEQKRFAISEQRYKAGIESYIVMITAQRDLFAAQQGLIDIRLARLTNAVALYRALGGGWK